MDVHLVFNSFNKMLSISYEIVFPAQALFLEHISSTYPYLLRELATLDLAKLVTLMFDSVAKGQLISDFFFFRYSKKPTIFLQISSVVCKSGLIVILKALSNIGDHLT